MGALSEKEGWNVYKQLEYGIVSGGRRTKIEMVSLEAIDG